MILFGHLPQISGGTLLRLSGDQEITTLLVDSRKAIVNSGAVFFAIHGDRHDGHQFIGVLYEQGVRQFVIEKELALEAFPEGNFLLVKSSITCIQKLVTHHRKLLNMPVIGITGSNGKTIVKEWLYQLLSPDLAIAKNPGSYNSQVGVPLSVWHLQSFHDLGIFEAGISRPGEMEKLAEVISPTCGIFTNVGTAHDEGFSSQTEKVIEKLKLFRNSKPVIYCRDHRDVVAVVEKELPNRTLSWGKTQEADIQIVSGESGENKITHNNRTFFVSLPFSDPASIENANHCVAMLIHLGYSPAVIQERISQLKTVPMRLELKEGINQCLLIDDTYNNDLAGLDIGLHFLRSLQKEKRSLILSDIQQSGMQEKLLIQEIADKVTKAGIDRFVGIGPSFSEYQSLFENRVKSTFYEGTEEFIRTVDANEFHDEAILIKGAREFRFEKITRLLQKKIHGTVMEVNLGAVVDNLNFFKRRLRPGVKLMVMVKAFAYGSGSEEVAGLLQYHQVDYLGVAYADEGVELRTKGIHLPIMVMNPTEGSFSTMLKYRLEPEIYSLNILQSLISFLQGKPCRIHIKVDTGMHRLGFEEEGITDMIHLLQDNPNLEVGTIFSHMAGADEPSMDAFSAQQYELFVQIASRIESSLKIRAVKHVLNSSGILRFPEMQLDMVRLGIGLYGVNPTPELISGLQPVATLRTIISQIKKVKGGDHVGYGQRGQTSKDITIATIPIGYADGFSRAFSGGRGSVLIHGKLAPVVGNVCMDMTMVNITDIPANEGDDVIIFGAELPLVKMAGWIDTIPYEILTNTSERVKRVFHTESI
jgi:Alr-MurF fusion protein